MILNEPFISLQKSGYSYWWHSAKFTRFNAFHIFDIVWTGRLHLVFDAQFFLPLYLNMLTITKPLFWFLYAFAELWMVPFCTFSYNSIGKVKDVNIEIWPIHSFLITLPSAMGFSHGFQPWLENLRIYFYSLLFDRVFVVAVGMTFMLEFLKKSIWAHQVHTIAEIVVRASEIMDSIRQQQVARLVVCAVRNHFRI